MTRGNGKLSILIYHHVLLEPDPVQPNIPTAGLFERHMRWLRRVFNVLPLPEAIWRLRDGSLPGRAVAITFDDGYADNHDVALPILKRLELSATFFIATGFLDGGRMWNDTVIEAVRRWPEGSLLFEPLGIGRLPIRSAGERSRAINVLLSALKHRPFEERAELVNQLAGEQLNNLGSPMMTSEQVRSLYRSGMVIGAHTRSHPILNMLPDDQGLAEIRDGKTELESILASPVELFAYPNGKLSHDFDDRHARMVEQLGFTAAVTTDWGAASIATDRFRLPRFTPWDRATPKFLARLACHRSVPLSDSIVNS